MLTVRLQARQCSLTLSRRTIKTNVVSRPVQRYIRIFPLRGVHSKAAASANDDLQPAEDVEVAADPVLPFPSTYHMPQLTGKERAALRAHTESMAKAKTLQRQQVGAQGITFNVLMAAMDCLIKHEYLRIKLGEGCGLERKETAQQLSRLLDAAVVGQVGFTITLYRKKGLPRPDNLVKPAAPAA